MAWDLHPPHLSTEKNRILSALAHVSVAILSRGSACPSQLHDSPLSPAPLASGLQHDVLLSPLCTSIIVEALHSSSLQLSFMLDTVMKQVVATVARESRDGTPYGPALLASTLRLASNVRSDNATASVRNFATAPLVTQQCRAERAPSDCARASAATH